MEAKGHAIPDNNVTGALLKSDMQITCGESVAAESSRLPESSTRDTFLPVTVLFHAAPNR
jgi:hypothetical protein